MNAMFSSALARAFSFFFLPTCGWLLVMSTCSGCALPIKRHSTSHYLIFGLGIVSINDTRKEAAVVSRSHALGLQFSTTPLLDCGIGYSSRSVVAVADGADDVRIEVSKAPGGYLVVIPDAESEQAPVAEDSAAGRIPLP